MKFAAFAAQIVFLLLATVFSELLVKKMGVRLVTVLLLAGAGLGFSALFLNALHWFAGRTHIPNPVMGTVTGLAAGLCIGLVASVVAGHALSWVSSFSIDYSQFGNEIGMKLVANVFPATVEETTFRGGIVHFVSAYLSPSAGIAAGSVPFGLIHFFGRLFGHPVTLQHAVGVSVAGALLSLLYLRFGLTAAFGCHWIWNALCGQWVKALGIPKQGGVQLIEGAWTTTIVLAALFLLVWALTQHHSQ